MDSDESPGREQPQVGTAAGSSMPVGRRVLVAAAAVAIFALGIVVGRTSLGTRASTAGSDVSATTIVPSTTATTPAPSTSDPTSAAAPDRPGIAYPPPPPVGSCLGDPSGDESTIVPCDQPHVQEVTAAFAASDAHHDAVAHHWDQYCADPTTEYLGVVPAPTPEDPSSPTTSWSLPAPAYGYNLVHAPADEQIDGVGWLACVVRAQPQVPYSGSIYAVASDPSRPAAFGSCGTGSFAESCAQPHSWEIIGQAGTTTAWQRTDDGLLQLSEGTAGARRLQDSCVHYAARMTGVADPTYDGALQVGVALNPYDQVVSVTGSQDGATGAAGPDSGMVAVTCQIVPTDAGRRLTDSLVGWGDHSPPLAAD